MNKFALLLILLFLSAFSVNGQNTTDQQLGLQFYNERDYQKAVEVFERLYKNKPDHFSYTYYLQSLLELGNTEEALKLTKQQARRFPDDAKYLVDQGYVMIRGNQTSKAIKLFEDLIKDMKPEQRYVMTLANAFMTRREFDFAAKAYLKGRQLLAPEQTFGFELAQLYEMQGQFDKMAAEYLSIIDNNPSLSDQVQSRLQFSLANDPDNLKTTAVRQALIMQVQRNPDNINVTELLVWLSLQLKDYESALLQAKALDRRLDENGNRVFSLGQLALSNANYEIATEAFRYVMDRSDDPALVAVAEIELLRAEYEKVSSSYPENEESLKELAVRYSEAIRKHGNTPLSWPLIRNLAHIEAFHLNNPNKAISLLEDLTGKTVNDKVLQAQCKLELADILLFSGEPWEATLLYSQVDKDFKNDPLGHEARFRNARLSFYIGEFEWSRAQLDVLKAATSKLIANDAMKMSLLITDNIEADSSTLPLASYARADLLLFRNQPQKALELLDSVMIAFPGHSITDDALMKKAEIKMKMGDFVSAESLYKEVVDNYPYDILADDALFDLATLYKDHIKDNTKAMEAYQKLMTDYPGSLYVVEARKQFRILRGDFKEDVPEQDISGGHPDVN
ncbi:MAG TPA: tetratricopeptide repeat protein [Lentimicrobium sp.]|nr:tetratricopeptide repeat protein [Lentimicrobium sp.]